jgi:hypothetical protein
MILLHVHGAGKTRKAALHIREGLAKRVKVLCEPPQPFQVSLELLFALRCSFQLFCMNLCASVAFHEAKFKFLNSSLLFLGLPASK